MHLLFPTTKIYIIIIIVLNRTQAKFSHSVAKVYTLVHVLLLFLFLSSLSLLGFDCFYSQFLQNMFVPFECFPNTFCNHTNLMSFPNHHGTRNFSTLDAFIYFSKKVYTSKDLPSRSTATETIDP